MRISKIILILLGLTQVATAQTWPKMKTNKDGSQVYTYQNGTTCIKHADYATEGAVSGKVSITKVFSGEGNASQKVVNALSYSPSVSAIQAALFDICTAFGSGATSQQQYDEEREALEKLQVAVIAKEAGQNLTTPAAATKNSGSDASTENSASKQPETKENSGKDSNSSKPDKSNGSAKTTDSTTEPPQKGNTAPSKNEMPAPKTIQKEAGQNPTVPQKTASSEETNSQKSIASDTKPTSNTPNEVPVSKPAESPSVNTRTTASPPQPFPAGQNFHVNLTTTCTGWDAGYTKHEKTLRADISFKADNKFESITETCDGEASIASGSWKRIGGAIAVSVTVKNENRSFHCTVANENKLSCRNLVTLLP